VARFTQSVAITARHEEEARGQRERERERESGSSETGRSVLLSRPCAAVVMTTAAVVMATDGEGDSGTRRRMMDELRATWRRRAGDGAAALAGPPVGNELDSLGSRRPQIRHAPPTVGRLYSPFASDGRTRCRRRRRLRPLRHPNSATQRCHAGRHIADPDTFCSCWPPKQFKTTGPGDAGGRGSICAIS